MVGNAALILASAKRTVQSCGTLIVRSVCPILATAFRWVMAGCGLLPPNSSQRLGNRRTIRAFPWAPAACHVLALSFLSRTLPRLGWTKAASRPSRSLVWTARAMTHASSRCFSSRLSRLCSCGRTSSLAAAVCPPARPVTRRFYCLPLVNIPSCRPDGQESGAGGRRQSVLGRSAVLRRY